MCLNCDKHDCSGCNGDEGVNISPETHEAVAQDIKKCHQVLSDLIEDFDQTGCSDDMGTVMTKNINAARKLLGMELIDYEEEPNNFLPDEDSDDEEPVST